jgi:hypothetical protein
MFVATVDGVVGFDVRSGEVVGRVGRGAERIRVSPAGDMVAMADRAGAVVAWRVAAGSQVNVTNLGEPLASMAWSRDGAALAIVSAGGKLHAWSARDSRDLADLDASGTVGPCTQDCTWRGIEVLPDGSGAWLTTDIAKEWLWSFAAERLAPAPTGVYARLFPEPVGLMLNAVRFHCADDATEGMPDDVLEALAERQSQGSRFDVTGDCRTVAITGEDGIDLLRMPDGQTIGHVSVLGDRAAVVRRGHEIEAWGTGVRDLLGCRAAVHVLPLPLCEERLATVGGLARALHGDVDP